MEVFYVILLAIIQGITEWLPVSSSAHLALAQQLLAVRPPVLFDIFLHFGTVAAVIFFMRNEIFDIFKSLIKADINDKNFMIATFVVVASFPTAVIGFTFRDFFETMFSNPATVGIALIITGIFLFICEIKKGDKTISAPASLFIGMAQGIAIAPGISRRGATIGTALLLGVNRETAARFSFLLSIPAIFGATVFEAKDISLGGMDSRMILLGPLVSAIVGYVTIGFFLSHVKEKGMRPFAYYCLLLGTLTFVLMK